MSLRPDQDVHDEECSVAVYLGVSAFSFLLCDRGYVGGIYVSLFALGFTSSRRSVSGFQRYQDPLTRDIYQAFNG